MTTTQGQGAGTTIEDAVMLLRVFRRFHDPEPALRAYEEARMARTTAMMAVSRGLEKGAQVAKPVPAWIRNHMMGLVFRTGPFIHRVPWYKEMMKVI
jgi:2-polyprenyl-6-methoxyphenol hydroxylase-like FAD-dependent oxidoreductase